MIRGERVDLVMRPSKWVNLVYQLDCMAGVYHHCARDAYREHWTNTLGWPTGEEDAVTEWHELRMREGSIVHPSATPPELPLPFPGGSLHAYSRIKHAGLRATSPADLLTRLELVSTQSELSRINHLLERFDERFAPYWEREGRGIVQRMHTGIERAFRENNLGEVVDRAASFYAASELHRRVDLLAMVRPKTGHEHTHGTQVAELAVFEILPDESAAERLPVVLHELFHYFYERTSLKARRRTMQAFADSKHPAAMLAWGLLNEALATALGNAIVQEQLDSKEAARLLAKPRGLYAEEAVDTAAKAALPLVRAALAEGDTMSSARFVNDYIAAVGERFGDDVRPTQYLRDHFTAMSPELGDAARKLRRDFRTGSVWGFEPIDDEAVEYFGRHPQMNATLFVTPAELRDDEARAYALVPEESHTKLRRELRRSTPFVLTLKRSPSSYLFVFVASTPAEVEAIGKRWVALPRTTAGVLR